VLDAFFTGVKWLRREVSYCPLSSAHIENSRNVYPLPYKALWLILIKKRKVFMSDKWLDTNLDSTQENENNTNFQINRDINRSFIEFFLMNFLLGLLHLITGRKKLKAPGTKQITMETFVVEF
jgi:hypothetical protein